MDWNLAAATSAIAVDPRQFIGIPFALVGAVFMSVGAQLQHRGVTKVGEDSPSSAGSSLNLRQLGRLFGRPSWVVGTILLGLAIVFQLVSLGFSPLIVVQPIGAVALVLTAVINSRVTHVALNRVSILAITLCVGGIAVFVTIASFTAVNAPMSDEDLTQILVTLIVVLIVFGVLFIALRKRASALYYIVGAGVLYGFVATLAKVIITTIFQGTADWLTWSCFAALLVAAALGAFFVQNAYSSGPPDLVIAGLTVIDPLVAVAIGIVILDEASQAPPWAIVSFVVAGAVAVVGVFMLSRYHPDAMSRSAATARASSAVK
jgi:drug/metabolite transporter (DMT)-like permease